MVIAVYGAGTMGRGIAQTFAAAGHEVKLFDVTRELAEKGKAAIAGGLAARVKRGKMTQEDAEAVTDRIGIGEENDLKGADIVIECVPETLAAKRGLFERLDPVAKEDAVFATNTSSLSVTAIAAGLRHEVIGMHFFNPVPAMKLVEVISGLKTPAGLAERFRELSGELGKTPVMVKDAPGFVVNRILIPMINEAVCVFAEGTASAEDIDRAMMLGANHPMGPLALGDLIGWDVVLHIMDTLLAETGDSKYRANVLIRTMVRAGKLGRKSGEGFYQYQ